MQAERRQRSGNRTVPALIFVHIPLWEFETAWSQRKTCFGTNDNGGITPTIHNTGLFAALEAAPEVQAVFVGHDHCNDFCCEFGERAIDLCFGRHSGPSSPSRVSGCAARALNATDPSRVTLSLR